MAAGNVVVYQPAFLATMLASINWASNTFICELVSHGYTPNAASHSDWSDNVAAYVLTTAGYAAKTLANQTVTQSSNSHIRFDADDVTFSASSTMTAKYAVLRHQTTDRVVAYLDLETGATSGVDATQIVVSWSANGLFRQNNTAA